MTDHPMLFSSPMIRALIREAEAPGTGKTQTRRILTRHNCEVLGHKWGKKSPWAGLRFSDAFVRKNSAISGEPMAQLMVPFWHPDDEPTPTEECGLYRLTPVIEVGDRIWVRETLRYDWGTKCWRYDADKLSILGSAGRREPETPTPTRWPLGVCVSMFMPRWASRLTLTVTAVKIERLQDISEEDAIAEGVEFMMRGTTRYESEGRDLYRSLWDSLHGEGAWAANPWIVAVGFDVTHANIDNLPKSEAA